MSKASTQQYAEATEIYEKAGQYAVYGFADDIGITSWAYCEACEDSTPDCSDNSCLVCGSPKKQPAGKFKIQMAAPFGEWGDLKGCDDHSNYETETFSSIEEARATIEELQGDLSEYKIDLSEYRIVPESHPQHIDFYE
jgi:hypothetical protein